MSEKSITHYLTKADGRALVESWQKSGLSQKSYCQANGIHLHKLAYWRRIAQSTPASTVGFVELQSLQRSRGLSLQVPGDCSMVIDHGFDRQLLRDIVEALS